HIGGLGRRGIGIVLLARRHRQGRRGEKEGAKGSRRARDHTLLSDHCEKLPVVAGAPWLAAAAEVCVCCCCCCCCSCCCCCCCCVCTARLAAGPTPWTLIGRSRRRTMRARATARSRADVAWFTAACSMRRRDWSRSVRVEIPQRYGIWSIEYARWACAAVPRLAAKEAAACSSWLNATRVSSAASSRVC